MLVQEEWNKSLARPSTFVKRQHQESLFLMWSTFKAILWWLNPWRAWDVHTCGVLSCRPLRILASTWQTLGRVSSVLLNAQWKCHEEMLSPRHYLDSNAFKVSRCQAAVFTCGFPQRFKTREKNRRKGSNIVSYPYAWRRSDKRTSV